MRNLETTSKNHKDKQKTMKNYETTLKNHGNQPKTTKKTMNPPSETIEINQKP